MHFVCIKHAVLAEPGIGARARRQSGGITIRQNLRSILFVSGGSTWANRPIPRRQNYSSPPIPETVTTIAPDCGSTSCRSSMINAIALAEESHPHIVIGMAHHPFHVLQDFDRRCVQARVEGSCLFFHCGHLHEPEAQATGFNSAGCLTLAAGASFETRLSHNAYSVVTLNLLQGKRGVRTVRRT